MKLAHSFSVIDSHTAGHPTRVILSGLPAMKGETVGQQRDHFRDHHDRLRGLLLHEPRGHAAMVGLVPAVSRTADFGAFFISSYIYLDMCGHATIGYAKTLAATGQLPPGTPGFSLETPAGVVDVGLTWAADDELAAVTLTNVPSYCAVRDVRLDLADGRSISADLAYGGVWYAIVDAAAAGLRLEPDGVSEALRLGAEIKARFKGRTDLPATEPSIMFIAEDSPLEARHLVVLAGNKFDRSPCGTGTSARLAQLHARGRLAEGQSYKAKSILGTSFDAIIRATGVHEGMPAITPQVTGMAHVTAFSTIICEGSDPLAQGFLCR